MSMLSVLRRFVEKSFEALFALRRRDRIGLRHGGGEIHESIKARIE